MSVPSIMEDVTLLENFDAAAITLAKLDFVAVGGGGLKLDVGNKLAVKGIRLLNQFGATELGSLAPIFRPESDYDYRYLQLRKDMRLRLEFASLHENPRSRKLIGYPFG